MAKRYEVTAATRRVNRFTSWLARLGLGRMEILTTRGRRSGQPRQVPVSPIQHQGVEYLVSPYGEVGWVRNVRADPEVALRHGSRQRKATLEEVGPELAAPVAAAYYRRERFARPYMDVPPGPSVDDFRRAAHLFPVFRVVGS